MRNLAIILPLVTGLMLGLAQSTSRLFLHNKNLSEAVLLGGVTASLYLFAVIQWMKVLKSAASLFLKLIVLFMKT